MIKSQAIALRCAAAMPRYLLFHAHRNPRRTEIAERFGVEDSVKRLPNRLVRQLERCKSDEARRIILGVSK